MNLKFNCILIALLLITSGAIGKRRSPKQAAQLAKGFVVKQQQNGRIRTATAKRKVQQAIYDGSGCYVFNVGSDEGFVVVSADDRTEAVLGYTTTGTFNKENISDNLRWWLGEYDKEIATLDKLQIDKETLTKPKTHEPITPLIQTHWNQDTPYNLKTPSNGKRRTATGCVATAMAQVFYYHKMDKTTTKIPAYTTGSHKFAMPELPATTFDWDKMRTTYQDEDSDEGAMEVAKLMLYCGQAVQMDYGYDASGAWLQGGNIERFFGFAPGITLLSRHECTVAQWDSLIYKEIAEGRPVIYTGDKQNKGYKSGHAFVCDGYDGKGYFHINWGWGGMEDGFFKLAILNPENQGTGGVAGKDGYAIAQTAVLGLSKTAVPHDYIKDYPRLTVANTSLTQTYDTRREKSQNFHIAGLFLRVWNTSKHMRSYDYGWALYKDNRFLNIVDQRSINNIETGYSANYTASLTLGADLEEGKYVLTPVFREKDTEEWTKCVDETDRCYEITIYEKRMDIAAAQKKLSLKINEVEIHGKKEVNNALELIINITNNTKYNTPELYLLDNGSIETAIDLSLDPDSTGTFSLHFTPTRAGKHVLKLSPTKYEKNYLYVDTIVVEEAKKMELTHNIEVTSRGENSNNLLKGNDFCISVTSKNKGQYHYHAPLLCTLYKFKENGYGFSIDHQSKEVDIKVGDSITTTFAFNNLETNATYCVTIAHKSEGAYTYPGEQSYSYKTQVPTAIDKNLRNDPDKPLIVYNIQGKKVAQTTASDLQQVLSRLPKGVYIVDGRKVSR